MLRFIAYAVPLVILLLALFGFTVELLDAEPRSGSVIRLALFEQPRVPGQLVIGTWLVEASGLIALFLLAQGRFGAWWLDGLVAGWAAWVFRGPLLVITIVVATKQPQDPWWKLAFGWWVLYSICGLSLAILARRSKLESWTSAAGEGTGESVPPLALERSSESAIEKDEVPVDETLEREPEEIDTTAVPETREVDPVASDPEIHEPKELEPKVLEPEDIDIAEPSDPEEAGVVEAQEPEEMVTTDTETPGESLSETIQAGPDAGRG